MRSHRGGVANRLSPLAQPAAEPLTPDAFSASNVLVAALGGFRRPDPLGIGQR
jgi:hypothetical protein